MLHLYVFKLYRFQQKHFIRHYKNNEHMRNLLTNDFPLYLDGMRKISLTLRTTLNFPTSTRPTFAVTLSITSNTSPRYLENAIFVAQTLNAFLNFVILPTRTKVHDARHINTDRFNRFERFTVFEDLILQLYEFKPTVVRVNKVPRRRYFFGDPNLVIIYQIELNDSIIYSNYGNKND